MIRKPTLLFIMPLLLTFASTACAGPEARDRSELLIFAAASLTDAFDAIQTAFEAEHPEFDVRISYSSTGSLREQITEGAPADVFASADLHNMDLLVAAGAALAPERFAGNEMQIAVPAGNPAAVTGLADLARPELLVGLVVEAAPAGVLARQILAAADVEPALDTEEPTVRALLGKIEAGELDVGILFRTDVDSTDLVDGVDIPQGLNLQTVYPIAVLTSSVNPAGARLFIDFVLSPAGQAILAELGFHSP